MNFFNRELVSRYAAAIVLLTLGGTLFGYYLFLHRKPFTQNAFVIADTQPVTPLVAGYLEKLFVQNHSVVRKGEKLLQIYREPYLCRERDLAFQLESAEAALTVAEHRCAAARAAVHRGEARMNNHLYLARQAEAMVKSDAVSHTYAEECRRAAEAAGAEVAQLCHSLAAARAERQMCRANVEALRHRHRAAVIDLEETTVRALSDGYVTNLHLSPGGCYRPGDILFTLVCRGEPTIQANFEETELSAIAPGQTASVWLWQYPGRRFRGIVKSVDLAAERRRSSPQTGVQEIAKENQWFLLPQRFPVEIRLIEADGVTLNPGGSAFVQIETPAHLWKQFFWRIFRWK